MVTPSLTVLGARSQSSLPHSLFLSPTQTCSQTNKHVVPHKFARSVQYEDKDRCTQSHLVYELQIIATPVL